MARNSRLLAGAGRKSQGAIHEGGGIGNPGMGPWFNHQGLLGPIGYFTFTELAM